MAASDGRLRERNEEARAMQVDTDEPEIIEWVVALGGPLGATAARRLLEEHRFDRSQEILGSSRICHPR
jgi:hypothetical protein